MEALEYNTNHCLPYLHLSRLSAAWCITIIMVLFENLQHYSALRQTTQLPGNFPMSFMSPSEIVLSVSLSEEAVWLGWKLLMDISLLTLSSLPPSLPLSWKWKNRKISPLGNQTWIVGGVGSKIWPTNFSDSLTDRHCIHSNGKSCPLDDISLWSLNILINGEY